MTDKPVVIKLAQPGYDVKTAGDENLIYNSNWPLLKIYKESDFTIPDVTQTTLITTHDLGFSPVFWYFANTPEASWLNNGNVGTAERSEFFGSVGDGTITVDSEKLQYVKPGFSFTSGQSRFYYYIFALDLAVQFTSPTIKVGTVSGSSNPTRVFKIAKEGRDVNSKNLDDFVIHSRARSPLIHSVNPSGSPTKSFTVSHNLGYLPMFFGYVKNAAGGYSLIPTGAGGFSSFQSNERTVTFLVV